MENVLIPIEVDEAGTQLVDARTLHTFLESTTRFNDWITRRITRYGFIENIDYSTSYSKMSSQSTNNLREGMQGPIEYGLTLDMAKQLCMVENNDKGMEARKYFIECERKARQLTALSALPVTYSEALRMLADQVDEKERTQKQLQLVSGQLVEAEQDRQILQNIVEPHGYIKLGEAAKIISHPHIGPNGIFKFLVGEGVLMKKSFEDKPYDYYARYSQFFKLRATRQSGGHTDQPYTQVMVNFNGVKWIMKRMVASLGPWKGIRSEQEIAAFFKAEEGL